mmetsp:Transcript_21920/g.62225  ORF Transcript_21920/g.62225 Transcript_21920/m.62225 type:complete len:240 (-) Transcript_21920:222-941(-)
MSSRGTSSHELTDLASSSSRGSCTLSADVAGLEPSGTASTAAEDLQQGSEPPHWPPARMGAGSSSWSSEQATLGSGPWESFAQPSGQPVVRAQSASAGCPSPPRSTVLISQSKARLGSAPGPGLRSTATLPATAEGSAGKASARSSLGRKSASELPCPTTPLSRTAQHAGGQPCAPAQARADSSSHMPRTSSRPRPNACAAAGSLTPASGEPRQKWASSSKRLASGCARACSATSFSKR